MANGLIAKLLGKSEPEIQNAPVEVPEDGSLPDLDDSATGGEQGTPVEIPKSGSKKTGGLGTGRRMVDLTPAIYKEAVHNRELKKNWIFVNAGIIAFSVLALSIIFVSTLEPKANLESQIKSNIELEIALSEYQEVNQAVEQMSTFQDRLNIAAGNEIDWSNLISSIQGSLPSGTAIKSIGINATGATSNVGAGVLVSFVADSPLGYADTLRAVQGSPGVSNVQVGGMTSSGESYQFSATFNYDGSIKTNRFPPSTGIPEASDPAATEAADQPESNGEIPQEVLDQLTGGN